MQVLGLTYRRELISDYNFNGLAQHSLATCPCYTEDGLVLFPSSKLGGLTAAPSTCPAVILDSKVPRLELVLSLARVLLTPSVLRASVCLFFASTSVVPAAAHPCRWEALQGNQRGSA